MSIQHECPNFQLKQSVFPWQSKGHNFRTEKVVKYKINLGLPFMVPDLVYKFEIISFRGTKVTEQKPKQGHIDMGKT